MSYMNRTPKDDAVVGALGAEFAQFEKLALMAKEQPATLTYVKAEMGRMLAQMPVERRIVLHRALLACGGKTARLASGRR